MELPDSGGRAARDRAYWQARQDALPVDFHGEWLEPHEVCFVERFLAAGEALDWIPRDPRTSTNDFIWTSNGALPVELKSTKARYVTIYRRLLDSASRAAKHSVEKSHFIVDLGREPLTDELRIALEGYNVGRHKYRLKRLWVMADGAIIEIRLNE